MKKNYTPLEVDEQELFCNYLKANNILFTATQNGAILGGKNRFAQMAKLKKTGLMPGMCDLIVFAHNKSNSHEIILIEMKRQKKSFLSDIQKETINKFIKNGYVIIVAFGAEDAIIKFKDYLNT